MTEVSPVRLTVQSLARTELISPCPLDQADGNFNGRGASLKRGSSGRAHATSLIVVEEEGVIDLDAVRQAVLPLISSTHPVLQCLSVSWITQILYLRFGGGLIYPLYVEHRVPTVPSLFSQQFLAKKRLNFIDHHSPTPWQKPSQKVIMNILQGISSTSITNHKINLFAMPK